MKQLAKAITLVTAGAILTALLTGTVAVAAKNSQPKPKPEKQMEARLDSILCVMDSETTVTLNIPVPLNWTDAHREEEAQIICDSLKITKRQEPQP